MGPYRSPLSRIVTLSLLLLSSLSLWTSILHCHSPVVATVARRLRYSYSWLRLILVVGSTVATPGEWQCKIRTGGVRRLAVANGPNIFQMLFVSLRNYCAPRDQCSTKHMRANKTNLIHTKTPACNNFRRSRLVVCRRMCVFDGRCD